MNIIAHNLMAMNAQRQLGIHSNSKIKTSEKTSSGYKINRAADDAAGLAISEKMRRQIRGLRQASENIQDGISFVQVADGALNEVHEILQRMNELSVKAGNGTYTDEDRSYIQEELNQLTMECDRIFKETEFNEQKIWQAPYIPYVTGIPRELKIYNETIDANGNITFGGIIWGTDRYSWNEIDADMYDASTGTFQPGTYTIDVPAMVPQMEQGDDTYLGNGNTITLNLTVSEEGLLTSISRKCDWTASEDGILMDGILYEWSDLENSAHNKCFDANNITPGNWGFNTYNGTHVWFEIPEGTKELSEVIDGINGSILDNLSWETQISTIQSDFAVGLVYGEDAAVLTAPTITITEGTKDNITQTYTLHANETGVWATNGAGTDFDKESWKDLGFENDAGEFIPPHDFTNHIYYEYGTDQPDNHAAATTGAYWHYTEGQGGYNTNIGLSVQFMVLEEASKQGIINGIDGVVIQTKIHTPSKATIDMTRSDSNKVSVLEGNLKAELSFDFHKKMQRDFDIEMDAPIGNGTFEVDAQANTIKLNIEKDGQSASFEAEETYKEIEDKVKKLLREDGGELSLTLRYGSDNLVKLSYQIDAMTADEKQIADTKEEFLNTKVANVLTDIFQNGTVRLSSGGYATQTIGEDRRNTNSLGFAETANNKASYANFSTRIKYTRQLDIQADGEPGEYIEIKYDVLNAAILGLVNVSVMDPASVGNSIDIIKNAIQIASEQRSSFGAYQNRLEHAKKSNDNAAENTTSAESRIRDADMAKEITENSMKNVLLQAGAAVLAQANQSNTTILSLLQ